MKEIIRKAFEENHYTVIPYDDDRFFFAEGGKTGIVKFPGQNKGFTIICINNAINLDDGQEFVCDNALVKIRVANVQKEQRITINVTPQKEMDERMIRKSLERCFFISEKLLKGTAKNENVLKAINGHKRKTVFKKVAAQSI